MFSVVIPTIIKGVTCPNPKKKRNKIDNKGFFAWETQAINVAKTGVIQGEEARPKAAPVINGAINGGNLFFKNSKEGPFGSWILMKPKRFKPITIAKIEINKVKKLGNCP